MTKQFVINQNELTEAFNGFKLCSRDKGYTSTKNLNICFIASGKNIVASLSMADRVLDYHFIESKATCPGINCSINIKDIQEICRQSKQSKTDTVIIDLTELETITIRQLKNNKPVYEIVLPKTKQSKYWNNARETFKTEHDGTDFINNFRKLLPAVYTGNIPHPVLSCVYVDVSKKQHWMVATNGQKITCVNPKTLPFASSFGLPKSKFLERQEFQYPILIGIDTTVVDPCFGFNSGPWSYLSSIISFFPRWR